MQRPGFGMPNPYSCKRWQTEQIKFDSAEVGGPVAFPDTVFIVTSAGLWGWMVMGRHRFFTRVKNLFGDEGPEFLGEGACPNDSPDIFC